MKVICVFFEKPNRELSAFAEACYRISPDLALRKEEAIFIETSRCEKIYSLKTAYLRIRSLLKKFNLKASIAIGNHPAEALCLAKNNSFKEGLNLLSLDFLIYVYDPFGLKNEKNLSITKAFQALTSLGIENLEDFQKLPGKTLISRFGAEAKVCWDRLKYPSLAQLIPWPKFKCPEKIVESQELLETEICSTLEPLLFKLKELLDRLTSRLRGRLLRVTHLVLELELDHHSAVREPKKIFDFAFFLPQGSSKTILSIMQEKLGSVFQLCPLESSVQRITLKVLETVPAKTAQTHFFNQKDEKEEALNELLGRVAEKIGKEHVYQAKLVESYVPEKSWKKTSLLKKSEILLSSFCGERPLRLFSEPKPLRKQGLDIFSEGQRWKIIRIQGPEKLNTEWWEDLCQRDYYKVETQSGEVLWVYKDSIGALFWHGTFE